MRSGRLEPCPVGRVHRVCVRVCVIPGIVWVLGGRDWVAQHFACLPFVALHPTSTDQQTSRAALQLRRSFLRPLFLCSVLVSRFPTCISVCVYVCTCAEGAISRQAKVEMSCTRENAKRMGPEPSPHDQPLGAFGTLVPLRSPMERVLPCHRALGPFTGLNERHGPQCARGTEAPRAHSATPWASGRTRDPGVLSGGAWGCSRGVFTCGWAYALALSLATSVLSEILGNIVGCAMKVLQYTQTRSAVQSQGSPDMAAPLALGHVIVTRCTLPLL